MSRDTKYMISVMQAFADGKSIQFYNKTRKDGWTTTSDPVWDWVHYDYRIKPEEPTYRPYESVAEMLCDYKSRVCKTNDTENTMPLIYIKTDRDIALITAYNKELNMVFTNTWWSMQELCEQLTYLDGTPVGRCVE